MGSMLLATEASTGVGEGSSGGTGMLTGAGPLAGLLAGPKSLEGRAPATAWTLGYTGGFPPTLVAAAAEGDSGRDDSLK